jgi:glycosyltransferase involved in cell wall biosynthesis
VTAAAPSLLLLIPAYNEEARIEPVLRDYAAHFRRNYPGEFQIVVVLNGCVDDTAGVVRRVAREFSEVSSLEFAVTLKYSGTGVSGRKGTSR